MTFAKGDSVTFTVRGFELEGAVIRHKKTDIVTVEAYVLYRMADGTPMLDMRETMWWDIPADKLSRI